MAIAVTSFGTGSMGNAAAAPALTTRSIFPNANTALVFLISYVGATAITSVTSPGATWTLQGTAGGGSLIGYMDMWTCSPGPSPSIGALTVTSADSNFTAATWDILQASGVDPSAQWMFYPGSFVSASALSTSTNLAQVTCNAVAATGDVIISGIATYQNMLLVNGVLPPAGFTFVNQNLWESNTTTFESNVPLWDQGSISQIAGNVPSAGFLMSGTTSGTYWAAMAIELLVAGSGLSGQGPAVTGYSVG